MYKMFDGETLIFGEKEVKENDFYRFARPLILDDLYYLDDFTVKVS